MDMDADRRTSLIAGTLALAVLAFLFVSVFSQKKTPGASAADSYVVSARFGQTYGLPVGAKVRMAGIDVGAVSSQEHDDYYGVRLKMRLRKGVALPEDSAASIVSESLFGGKYVEISPGNEDAVLEDGGVIGFTQDSMPLTDILTRIIDNLRAKKQKTEERLTQ